MGIQIYLQQRILKKEVQVNKRKKEMKNLLDMRSLLVLCSVGSYQEWVRWNAVFLNASFKFKKIDVLAFVDGEKMPTGEKVSRSTNVIYPKQLNWLGKMKRNNELPTSVGDKYDLLIDLNFADSFILNWIFVKASAGLKVGSSHRETMLSYFDLMIKTESAEEKPKLYIDQVFYFLQNINKNENS